MSREKTYWAGVDTTTSELMSFYEEKKRDFIKPIFCRREAARNFYKNSGCSVRKVRIIEVKS